MSKFECVGHVVKDMACRSKGKGDISCEWHKGGGIPCIIVSFFFSFLFFLFHFFLFWVM